MAAIYAISAFLFARQEKEMFDKKEFMRCEMCGGKLIAKTPSGLYHFAFGRMLDENQVPLTGMGDDERLHPIPAVELKIHGVIRMKCFRVECRKRHPDHWNEFSLF